MSAAATEHEHVLPSVFANFDVVLRNTSPYPTWLEWRIAALQVPSSHPRWGDKIRGALQAQRARQTRQRKKLVQS